MSKPKITKYKKQTKNPKCKYCWDKGFFSELTRETASPDFIGDKEFDRVFERKNYCMQCVKGRKMARKEYGQIAN